jgi:hypothetical protein
LISLQWYEEKIDAGANPKPDPERRVRRPRHCLCGRIP